MEINAEMSLPSRRDLASRTDRAWHTPSPPASPRARDDSFLSSYHAASRTPHGGSGMGKEDVTLSPELQSQRDLDMRRAARVLVSDAVFLKLVGESRSHAFAEERVRRGCLRGGVLTGHGGRARQGTLRDDCETADGWRQRISALVEQINQIETDALRAKKHYEDLVLDVEMSGSMNQLDGRRMQEILKKTREMMQKNHEEFTKSKEKLQGTIFDLRKKLESSYEENMKLQEQIAAQDSNETNKQVISTLDHLKQYIAKSMEQSENEKERFLTLLTEKDKQKDELSKDIRLKDSQIASLQAELAVQQQKLSALETSREDASKQILILQQQLADKESLKQLLLDMKSSLPADNSPALGMAQEGSEDVRSLREGLELVMQQLNSLSDRLPVDAAFLPSLEPAMLQNQSQDSGIAGANELKVVPAGNERR
eukprot:764249-Hanusia_phi.AAC.2